MRALGLPPSTYIYISRLFVVTGFTTSWRTTLLYKFVSLFVWALLFLRLELHYSTSIHLLSYIRWKVHRCIVRMSGCVKENGC